MLKEVQKSAFSYLVLNEDNMKHTVDYSIHRKINCWLIRKRKLFLEGAHDVFDKMTNSSGPEMVPCDTPTVWMQLKILTTLTNHSADKIR